MRLEIEKDAKGWVFTRAGKPVMTPQGTRLYVPAKTLAVAVAAEWPDKKKFSADAMPLTSLTYTAIDRVMPHKEKAVEEVMAYAQTDVLCYRAEETALIARQREQWDPVIAWIEARYDVHIETTSGIMPLAQASLTVARLQAAASNMDAFELGAFSVLVRGLGSLMLALAVKEKYMSAEEAYAASRVDEAFQRERWGDDEEASARAARGLKDVVDAERFLVLLS